MTSRGDQVALGAVGFAWDRTCVAPPMSLLLLGETTRDEIAPSCTGFPTELLRAGALVLWDWSS